MYWFISLWNRLQIKVGTSRRFIITQNVRQSKKKKKTGKGQVRHKQIIRKNFQNAKTRQHKLGLNHYKKIKLEYKAESLLPNTRENIKSLNYASEIVNSCKESVIRWLIAVKPLVMGITVLFGHIWRPLRLLGECRQVETWQQYCVSDCFLYIGN